MLYFNKLLDRMQKTLNIFRDEGGLMADRTQVCELFRKIQHPKLQDTTKALEFRAETVGIIYSEAANHLTADVYKMLEYQFFRKVSIIQTSGGNSGGNSGGGGPRKGGCKSSSI